MLQQSPTEMRALRELTERAGSDPLLTQGSTGNSSIKVDGAMWIKASGRSMMDALREEIFTSLSLAEVKSCLRRHFDPSSVNPAASLETAMHATIPHPVVLHVHCVDTIAWAVRRDAERELSRRLTGLRWHWIPYVDSGLPLAEEIGRALRSNAGIEVFVLGNHGLVVGGPDPGSVEALLAEVRTRLAIVPRSAHPADDSMLAEMSKGSCWGLPKDDALHSLATDTVACRVLGTGLLYPCQAIFAHSRNADPFRAVPCSGRGIDWNEAQHNRRFLIVEGRGVLVHASISQAELEMISGLASVVRRLDPLASLRYLLDSEVARIATNTASRYRALCETSSLCRTH